jgi:type I restriction enzyme S subunit
MTALKTRLGELGAWGSGGTPLASRAEYYGGNIPWLIIEDLNDGLVEKAARKITRLGLENSSAKVVPPGTLLIAMYGSIGKLGITKIECATNQAIGFCRCDPAKVDTLFLFYLLLHERSRFLRAGRGGTQQNISQEFLRDYEVAIPPLPDQHRIAAQLDQADRLRRTRRYALELSDSFLSAAFLELFGDPVRNPIGWPCTELEDIAQVDRGKFTPRPRGDPSYYGGNFPFIQTGDISKSGGRLNSWMQTLNEKGVSVSRSFPPGTVVIAIVGATIGMTAILEFEMYCPDSVVGIQADVTKTNAAYVEMLLRFWRRIFVAQAPETARANINLDTLRPLRIPVPPLPLQHQFANLVARHERVRAVQRESLRQAEHLFKSLLQHAFTI